MTPKFGRQLTQPLFHLGGNNPTYVGCSTLSPDLTSTPEDLRAYFQAAAAAKLRVKLGGPFGCRHLTRRCCNRGILRFFAAGPGWSGSCRTRALQFRHRPKRRSLEGRPSPLFPATEASLKRGGVNSPPMAFVIATKQRTVEGQYNCSRRTLKPCRSPRGRSEPHGS